MYNTFAEFYDELTYDVDYKKRTAYLIKLFKKYDKMPTLLLDVACGTGGFSNEFAKQGVEVIGADMSEEMLNIARQRSMENGLDVLYLCQKAEELEIMSANIGKLYLVSKASAKTIVAKSEESSAAIALQNEKQLENIEDTQASLKDIADSILSASKTFVSKLDDLQTSLNNVKTEVSANNTESAKVSEEFAELYAKLG